MEEKHQAAEVYRHQALLLAKVILFLFHNPTSISQKASRIIQLCILALVQDQKVHFKYMIYEYRLFCMPFKLHLKFTVRH